MGASDGSVKITTGGIEIGQGINTKVAQVCAFVLGCPLSMITVGEADTDLIPNNSMTGGSGTSESSCMAMKLACEQLATRLAPYLKKETAAEEKEDDFVQVQGQPAQYRYPADVWSKACAAAAGDGIQLLQDGWFAPQAEQPKGAPMSKAFDYYIYCA